jgi:hypothetical protein
MNDLWAKKAWKGAQLQKDYSKKKAKKHLFVVQ